MARKAANNRVDSPSKSLGAPATGAPAAVTLAVNAQNVALLALTPQVPKALGAVLQFLGELFTPAQHVAAG